MAKAIMKLKVYIEKGGRKLRLGYTTGSCAAAAAKAAAMMLLTGEMVTQVKLKTPKGLELILDIEDIHAEGEEWVSCAVEKDSGDDPDITNHALIYARVSPSEKPGIQIDGGEGVGRVTKPGLDQPVGNAAINSTPRRMIEEAVLEVMRGAQGAPAGLNVTVFVPRGQELAAKTFNPKLGVLGGISILGTTGIVEPMSDQALLDTIKVEMRVRREEGFPVLPAAPGNYGKNFFLGKYGFPLETAVTTSNFICDAVRMAADEGFQRMLFVGHIGKLVKVAGGIPNTHSRYGDHRMEILWRLAEDIIRQGDGDVPAYDGLRQEIEGCAATDEAINILHRYSLDEAVCAEMTRRIKEVMEAWSDGRMQIEAVVFSNVHGELGRTEHALQYMQLLREQVEGSQGEVKDDPFCRSRLQVH